LTLRIGLIGCGTVARRLHLPAFKACPDAEVVAFASHSLASAEAAAAEYGSGGVFGEWRDLIGAVDAVDVCSPNSAHAAQAIEAAQAGRHVLVEKPMACTVAEADAMVAAARAAGVVLAVAHNMRYVPAAASATSPGPARPSATRAPAPGHPGRRGSTTRRCLAAGR
jgi:predicted dehydrogenase